MGPSFEFIIRNSKNTQDDTINRSANAQMVDSTCNTECGVFAKNKQDCSLAQKTVHNLYISHSFLSGSSFPSISLYMNMGQRNKVMIGYVCVHLFIYLFIVLLSWYLRMRGQTVFTDSSF